MGCLRAWRGGEDGDGEMEGCRRQRDRVQEGEARKETLVEGTRCWRKGRWVEAGKKKGIE